MAIKHKCFISYHHDDQKEVDEFIKTFATEREAFIVRGIGIMEESIINSTDMDYVMRRIREKYLTDSTVTIVLIGKCTWARKFVDWEIASSLRHDSNNKRSGLLAINLPSVGKGGRLPDRLSDNVKGKEGDDGYARWYVYPTRKDTLANWIDEAFNARDTKVSLIVNSRELRINNGSC